MFNNSHSTELIWKLSSYYRFLITIFITHHVIAASLTVDILAVVVHFHYIFE